MGAEENRRTAERMFELLEQRDFEAAKPLFAEGFIQEWPQSGERIRGVDDAMAINENYPGYPTTTVRRVVASGDLVVAEYRQAYGDRTYASVHVLEFEGDRIAKQTDYFSEAFDAPGWRAQWVERM